jgi:hypothetical protein
MEARMASEGCGFLGVLDAGLGVGSAFGRAVPQTFAARERSRKRTAKLPSSRRSIRTIEPQPGANRVALDLVELSLQLHRVVVVHLAVLHVTERRGYVVFRSQRSGRIGGVGRCDHQVLVPPGKKLFPQIAIGLLQGASASHT